jgi:hypothetical protein
VASSEVVRDTVAILRHDGSALLLAEKKTRLALRVANRVLGLGNSRRFGHGVIRSDVNEWREAPCRCDSPWSSETCSIP